MEERWKLDETGQDVTWRWVQTFEQFTVDVCIKMLDNFKSSRAKDSFWHSYFKLLLFITEEYIISEPDPTMERPNNFIYLDYFHS